MIRILFQGDSITDAGRDRANPRGMGAGYPAFLAAKLGLHTPGRYELVNRAVSGDRIPDLVARYNRDFLLPRPDVVSILVGVNDVWHEAEIGNGVGPRRFAALYRMLLSDLATDLDPAPRLLLLEPFFLPGSAVGIPAGGESDPGLYDFFARELPARAQIVRDVAAEFGAIFIPLQEKFNEAAQIAPSEHWLRDGIHPTPAGHALIAREWLAAFRTLDL